MRRWLHSVLAVVALAGCAELPGDHGAGTKLGPALQRFVADGRISLRQGARSDHLKFDWRHEPERDVVLFSSPLGQGLAELGREASGAWLLVPGQAEQRAADLQTLAHRLFGAALPLEALVAWLGGAQSELLGEVDGWQFAVTESAVYRGHVLPRRIEIRRDDVELRIVIGGWSDHD